MTQGLWYGPCAVKSCSAKAIDASGFCERHPSESLTPVDLIRKAREERAQSDRDRVTKALETRSDAATRDLRSLFRQGITADDVKVLGVDLDSPHVLCGVRTGEGDEALVFLVPFSGGLIRTQRPIVQLFACPDCGAFVEGQAVQSLADVVPPGEPYAVDPTSVRHDQNCPKKVLSAAEVTAKYMDQLPKPVREFLKPYQPKIVMWLDEAIASQRAKRP